jgi:hypothetical protein
MLFPISDMGFPRHTGLDAVLTLKPTTTIFEAPRALFLKIQVFGGNTPYKLLNNIYNRIQDDPEHKTRFTICLYRMFVT